METTEKLRAHREKHIVYMREWHRKNKALMLAKGAVWLENHRQERNRMMRDWRTGNVVYAAKRRAARAADPVGAALGGLKRSAKGAPCATRQELLDLLAKQGGVCGLTGLMLPEGKKPHLDHIVPQAKGGSHTIENLRWTDPMANRAKGGHSDEEFLAWWNGHGDRKAAGAVERKAG